MPQIPSLITYFKRNLFLGVGITIFLAVLGGLYLLFEYYQIKNVVILNNTRDLTLSGLPAVEGKNIIFTSDEVIQNIIKTSNASVKSVTVTKEFPQTVLIKIETYEVLAYLKSADGYFLLAEEGAIVGKSKEQPDTKKPVISYYQNIPFAQYQAGQQLTSKDIQDSLYFLKALYSMKIKINTIDIVGFHMLGLYTDEKKYFFTSEKDRTKQVYHIDQAIQRFKQDKREYKSIDVRFDKPVIAL